MSGLRQRVLFVVLPLGVANAEMLSLTARRRLVRSRTGRSRHDCPKSRMRHIAPGGRIDGRHADLGGLGQFRTFDRTAKISPCRRLGGAHA